MNGTFHATRGLPRRNDSNPGAQLRLVLLGLTALVCSLLIIGVSRTTWDRLDRLERAFSGLKAESFYLGVRMRGRIQRMNDTLLRYRLRGEPDDAELFRSDARDLQQWLETSQTNTASGLERGFFQEMGAAYGAYLTNSLKGLEPSLGRLQSTQAREFKESYEKVQQQSQHLLDLCDKFINNQSTAFENFLEESQQTLAAFQRLLKVSLGLLLSLAGALFVLVYRGMIAPLRDRLTESEAVIARQEKLVSLGVLAAGVAHEIRNPLTAIKFRLFSLKKTLSAAHADNEDAEVISTEITRLDRIVQDFLKFARPSEPVFVVAPAQRIAHEVFDLLKPQLDKLAIELKLDADEPAWVRADTQQIKQVLINLIQNSADSIGRNGVITLRVRRERPAGRKRTPSTVALDVADNGKGIQPGVQKRLFDPFFTTKEGGTGLGLPIAARIVEKHGGQLRYETELGRGTTFSVVLPRVTEHESQNPAH